MITVLSLSLHKLFIKMVVILRTFLFDHGLESTVFGHFGSVGYFLVVDVVSGAVETIANADRDHLHGQCQPLAALGGKKVDAVVASGIGGGALQKLLSSGIKVYRAVEGTLTKIWNWSGPITYRNTR